MAYFIGVDSGGTFTDCVIMDETGEIIMGKAPSTPEDFSIGVLEALRETARSLEKDARHILRETLLFAHGTTIATNTIINRTGSRTGLITTRGFEDTILIMRVIGRIAGLGEMEVKHIAKSNKPDPIVPRSLIKGVKERVDYKGRILIPLDKEDCHKAVEELIQEGVDAIAVSLLWSFVNPSHEKEIKAMIQEINPKIFVTLSSELIPIIGEYERTSTTALNAYLGPGVSRYLTSLAEKLKEEGFSYSPIIMQSYGGCLPCEKASIYSIGLVSSGPAGGVMGSKYLANLLGYENVITTDVGGTSFDVGLIYSGVVEEAKNPSINQYNILTPMVEVKSIGAAGGSIAWIEPYTNLLKVGPISAGAMPGPVCYDRGGKEPTVTDVDLVLGYLNPEYFLGGRIRLNKDKAIKAIHENIAIPLGISAEEAAYGIFRITNAHMSDLIRKATIEKGYDPRRCVLFSYGGAGPIHASSYGKELGVKEIIIPFTASVHSAMGILSSNIVHSYEFSDYMSMPADVKRVNANFEKLEKEATDSLLRENFKREEITLKRYMDMRFRRQIHEVRCPIRGGELTEKGLEEIADEFVNLYERMYGKGAAFKEAGIDIVNFRIVAEGTIIHPKLKKLNLLGQDSSKALKQKREVFFASLEDFILTNVYDFNLLAPGNEVKGPSIIESTVTTIVINPGQVGIMDEYRNIISKDK